LRILVSIWEALNVEVSMTGTAAMALNGNTVSPPKMDVSSKVQALAKQIFERGTPPHSHFSRCAVTNEMICLPANVVVSQCEMRSILEAVQNFEDCAAQYD